MKLCGAGPDIILTNQPGREAGRLNLDVARRRAVTPSRNGTPSGDVIRATQWRQDAAYDVETLRTSSMRLQADRPLAHGNFEQCQFFGARTSPAQLSGPAPHNSIRLRRSKWDQPREAIRLKRPR